ncbi:MAG: CBS domain-containing protein [Chlamydiae bacterium]|nr:CBS domain-containing protein [Chlamydiota bacterium]MBI3267264.1 CBS domain-containing protein [Chlamydiota bacterium]
MPTSKPVEVLLKEKKIYEIVNPRLVQAGPDISIKEAIRLMQERHAGYIVIAKDQKVVGLFAENEVVLKILENNVDWDQPVSLFMNSSPVTLNIKDPVGKAIDLMGHGNFYHIPLVDENNHLMNVLSVRTLIRFLSEFYPTEVYNLPPKHDQIILTQEGG